MERIQSAGGRRGMVLHAEKSVGYQYEAPVREVMTRLRMFPQSRHGSQHLLHQELEVWPPPCRSRIFRDPFGNEVREFSHSVIEKRLQFSLRVWTEHRSLPRRAAGRRVPAFHGVPASGNDAFLEMTGLVDASEELERAARQLAGAGADARERAGAISRWVYRTMRFQSGATSIETRAGEALAGRVGVCQDYTHIMLALCRLCGIPARYVSGFIPAEGYMHAWVEVLTAAADARFPHWIGFDPTHNRPTDHRYLTVAVGRDYTDIAPLSGSFYGSAPGRLNTWSRTVALDAVPELRPGVHPPVVTDRFANGNTTATPPGYAC